MNVNYLLELLMNENKFIYEGKTYKAIPVYGEGECKGCHLFYDPTLDCVKLLKKGIRPPCCPDKRQDGREVIFITAV